MKIKISAVVDIGKERDNNEDAYIFCSDLSFLNWQQNEMPSYIYLGEYGALMVVADGMGGENAGEVASETAINSIKKSVINNRIEKAAKSDDSVEQFLKEIIKEADDSIKQKIDEDYDTIGMGTTIVICWLLNNKAHIAWCGDSRCYVYNHLFGLKQLTKDHSLVQELVDKGEITEEEAFSHPDNNIITRGLGDLNSQSIPDIINYTLTQNDIILLCSDGLCGYCTNKEIESTIEKNSMDITKCRDELMKLALDTGGYDNICIALASIIDDEQSMPTEPSAKQKLYMKIKYLFNS